LVPQTWELVWLLPHFRCEHHEVRKRIPPSGFHFARREKKETRFNFEFRIKESSTFIKPKLDDFLVVSSSLVFVSTSSMNILIFHQA